MDKYPHLSFKRAWDIDIDCAFMLGECHAYVKSLSDIPLNPAHRNRLLKVSLIKGAHATTAIEGNTLSQEEIERLHDGWRLPPSKEYLQIEVTNILDSFNALLKEIVEEKKERYVTPDLIREFHQMIGKDLGQHFDAKPGKFREDSRVVGPYLPPAHKYVPRLVEELCIWLRKEFRYTEGNHQDFKTAIIQAIVTHVYLEWIHPFGDGNGRTGRLLEFYILLRAGLPSIVSHILSNFYNETRSEYYRQIDQARKNKNLTEFIKYAVCGFRDGLKDNLRVIQDSQFIIFWRYYIYEAFKDVKYTKRDAFKRKRELVLKMGVEKEYEVNELLELTPGIAKMYATTSRATILRDLSELQILELVVKIGRKYKANTEPLKAMMPSKKSEK